jgi:Flp pilus assembly protein protease CpaA
MFLKITLTIALLFSTWLITCSVFDWRKREVPNILTLTPFAIAVIWSAIYGNPLAAILSVAMLFITNLQKGPALGLTALSLTFAGFGSILLSGFSLQASLQLIIIVGFSLLWYFGKTGGSDVKILITLTLFFGTPLFLYAVIAGGIAGVLALIVRAKELPYVVPISAGAMVYFAVYLLGHIA